MASWPFNPGDTDVMSAVYVGHDHLAARIRAFVDFLAEQMAVSEFDPVH